MSAPIAVLALAFATAQAGASRDEDLFLRPDDLRTVLFGSLDAGRSMFSSWGVKRTLTGPLDRTGFIVLEKQGAGLTRERFDATPGYGVFRLTSEASVLVGYQWAGNGLFTSVAFGPETRQEQLSLETVGWRVSRPRLGLQGHAEVWANPTPNTMLAATVIAGTTRGSVWARAAGGLQLWKNVFAGPEATVYATPTYTELRYGAHVTGLSIGILHLRLSGGLQQQDDGRRPSPYLGVASWLRL